MQKVANIGDLSAGQALEFSLNTATGPRAALLICDAAGEYYATARDCTHGEVSLIEGEIGVCEVECWAHGAVFNLRTGAGTLPAVHPLATYQVEIKNQEIFVLA